MARRQAGTGMQMGVDVAWRESCFRGAVRAWRFMLAGWLLGIWLALAPTALARDGVALEFRDGLLWVEVHAVATGERFLFLLDSGASTSVLDRRTAQRLGLKLGTSCRVAGVGGTVRGHWPVRWKARLGPWELPHDWLALDLTRLSDRCGRSIDGLVGADFFRGRVLEIDYRSGLLSEVEAASGGEPGDTTGAGVATLETRMEFGLRGLRVGARVNGGGEGWFRVDTGCASALEWTPERRWVRKGAVTRAVGLTTFSVPQVLTGIDLGGHRVDMVPTGLHERAIFPGEAGLVGNGLLAQFGVVRLDSVSGRLRLGGASAKRGLRADVLRPL